MTRHSWLTVPHSSLPHLAAIVVCAAIFVSCSGCVTPPPPEIAKDMQDRTGDSYPAEMQPRPEIMVGVNDRSALDAMKSFYVVLDPSADSTDEDNATALKAVQQALAARGGVATVGPVSAIPASIDCKVIVRPQWFWDMGKYLLVLYVEFSDNRTGKIVVYASSHRAHPIVRRPSEFMANELVEAIYR